MTDLPLIDGRQPFILENKVLLGDCLELLRDMPDKSVDLSLRRVAENSDD